MKSFLYIIALIFLASEMHATGQESEKINYKGKTWSMLSTPLESYFSEEQPRPDKILNSSRTSNWRGYIGHWKIENDGLYLEAVIRERYEKQADGESKKIEYSVPANQIFGSGSVYPIPADWFSGNLILPNGEQVTYVHMGYGSRYESEIILTILDGKLASEVESKYDPEPDAYRSQADMSWVALGGRREVDQGDTDWMDARFVLTSAMGRFMDSGTPFVTRGVYFTMEDRVFLTVPETLKTEQLFLPISKVPDVRVARGDHVEMVCVFVKAEEGYELHATKIESLPGGKSIHNPTFPEAWKRFEKWLEERQAK
ncbi:MAG: hypothetical protein ACSHYA_04335 [Opitutaceae bacterium]